jgi:hypothetical protein
MAFAKGKPKEGGRKKGTRNKTTDEAKSIINRIVDKSLGWAEQDIEKIRKQDPIKGFELAMKLMEYAYPKLKSIDINGAMDVNHKVEKIVIEIKNGNNENKGTQK